MRLFIMLTTKGIAIMNGTTEQGCVRMQRSATKM